MKNKAEKILLLLLLICCSCSSVYRFSIDIQEPALISLPVSAQNVIILNNTATQPKNYGIERTFDGRSIRPDYPLSLDTMVWSAIVEIALVFNESNFFNTVAVYRQPIRTDTEWLAGAELSPEDQYEFYEDEGYDALLVIDRLLFSVNENVKKIQTGSFSSEPYAFVDLRAEGIITCSMYSYGNDKPLTTFTISDSLFAKSTISNDSIILFKEIPEYVIDELSRTLGNKVANRFIPTWKTSERLLFTNFSPRMQEAAGFAADRQWTSAESIWMAEFQKKTKPADKAKVAFNLAIANEMKDNFEKALEWTQKAKEHLNNTNSNNYTLEIELVDKYMLELNRRIKNNRLLDLQWGKE
jgi:hypothetical protein